MQIFLEGGLSIALGKFLSDLLQCEAGHYGSSTRGVFKSNKEQPRESLDPGECNISHAI